MSSSVALKDQSIEDLEKENQWWWAAEKRRSKRLDYLRKAMWKKGAVGGLYNPGVKVDLEKGQLAMEPWTANAAFPEPEPIRFARELAHYLDNKTIFITDKAQLVGYVGSLPNTIFWDPAMGEMLNEEVYNDATVIPDPVDDNLKEVAKLCDFWAGKTMQSRIIPQFDLEDMMKIMSGAVGWGQADEAPGILDDSYGWEVNLGMAYKLYDNLTYELHFGWWATGDFFELGGLTETEDVMLLSHHLSMKF